MPANTGFKIQNKLRQGGATLRSNVNQNTAPSQLHILNPPDKTVIQLHRIRALHLQIVTLTYIVICKNLVNLKIKHQNHDYHLQSAGWVGGLEKFNSQRVALFE